MQCPQCATVLSDGTVFCTHCGTSLTPVQPVGVSSYSAAAAAPALAATQPMESFTAPLPPMAPAGLMPQEKVKRIIGYIIDGLICMPLYIFMLLPIIGWILDGILLSAYWLLRDYKGASIGKNMMGSTVVTLDGGVPSTQQKIMRNIGIGVPFLVMIIPIAGVVIFVPTAIIAGLAEAICFFMTDRRIGDHLAGTMVVRRPGA